MKNLLKKSIEDLIKDYKTETFNLKILLIGGAIKEKSNIKYFMP